MTALHILGGGPAGLAAAHYAHARGLDFTLYEASDETGGNCRTLTLGDCRYDTGAHRLHARDPETTALFRDLLGDDLLSVTSPSRIVRGGKTFAFPPEPLDLLRRLTLRETARVALDFGMRLARGLLPGSTHRPPSDSFLHLAVNRYGKTLADLFLLGYTRKLWGRDPATLAPAVAGGRLEGLSAWGLMRTSLGVTSKPQATNLDGAFLYPKHGIGRLFRALESRLPSASVHTNSRVTRIRHDGTRILALRINDGPDQPVDHVISTLPFPSFLRSLDPPPPREILDLADHIVFRNLILCVLRLEVDRFTPNASLYFPDPAIPFTRLYEPKNRSAALAPRGETCLVLEIPCDPDDATWREKDDSIARNSIAALERALPFPRDAVLDWTIQRIPHAYPVLEKGIEKDVATLLAYCGRFSNLRLAGRNALFRYAHIHDMFRQGRDAVERVGSWELGVRS